MHPQALGRDDALRMQSEGRRVRAGAALSFLVILLSPLLLTALVLYLLWQLF
jgi:hypothetical protein